MRWTEWALCTAVALVVALIVRTWFLASVVHVTDGQATMIGIGFAVVTGLSLWTIDHFVSTSRALAASPEPGPPSPPSSAPESDS